jgi:hypothetical protein
MVGASPPRSPRLRQATGAQDVLEEIQVLLRGALYHLSLPCYIRQRHDRG